ncbi:hypothetical protein [Dyella sp. A6]|uniref:hypothetical protein n=1 Tax=Dyella aluminiiresistens TaxID=3069105 RepID=UPI002E77C78C|nr:hypothetical protein [Dyella sp. A6]
MPLRPALVLAAALLAAPVLAQTSSDGKPLNLKLPPETLPASSSTAAAPAHAGSVAAAPASRAPGVYYGDTSGRMGNTGETARSRPACDDSTYNQTQMHGSVGAGVVAGNHMSGNYQSGMVNISKAFGSCDDPEGGISISIGASNGHFHGH